MPPEAPNAADRKSIRALEKTSKLAETQDREAVVGLMASASGRAWLLRQLEAAHIFSEDFTGNALREAFQKGERNFGLRLFNDILRFCPDEYLTMMRERNERDSRDHNDNRSATGEFDGSPNPDGGDSGRVPDAGSALDYDIYGAPAEG